MKIWPILAALAVLPASAFSAINLIDFESNASGFQLGDEINLYTNWTSSSGTSALIIELSDDTQALAIQPSFDVPTVTRSVASGEWGAQTVAYLDVWIRPVVDLAAGVHGFDFDAAILRFPGDTSGGGLSALNGGYWTEETVGFEVDEYYQATEWMRITIRRDYVSQKWDLFVNGSPLYANLGAGTVASPTQISFIGGVSGEMLVDNLQLLTANPLFSGLADSDGDGMPDAYEIANGLNPYANDRGGDPDGDNATNIEEFFASTPPTTYAAAGPILYVNKDLGASGNSGAYPYPAGTSGPKSSLSSAISAATSGTRVIMSPGSTAYVEGTISVTNKTIRIKPIGTVHIQ